MSNAGRYAGTALGALAAYAFGGATGAIVFLTLAVTVVMAVRLLQNR